MNLICELQKSIDLTDYWDMEILDLDIKYFCDEITMLIYNNDESSWKFTFKSCNDIKCSNYIMYTNNQSVKTMKKSQLGYYGQDIKVIKSDMYDNIFNIKMDLSIMNLEFCFKDMKIEEITNSNYEFFWNKQY